MGGEGGGDRETPLKVRNNDIWVISLSTRKNHYRFKKKLRQVGVDLEHKIRFSESKI